MLTTAGLRKRETLRAAGWLGLGVIIVDLGFTIFVCARFNTMEYGLRLFLAGIFGPLSFAVVESSVLAFALAVLLLVAIGLCVFRPSPLSLVAAGALGMAWLWLGWLLVLT